ncbi:glycoside hydrolase domain-containing protein [Puniceicoccus vermicola]|uniref:DUF4091 domain-containing protein n=1 Tax=Puniceicoccus vermicola TaxID=388746 RepID=A0A7X1E469_9BACT|nr:glycoside hydrolase domain-containing protein [Puniceicoccus vermicola]MBC2601821.1 DUF4091 domain-containing protein [Puniceicoccus vermicola]
MRNPSISRFFSISSFACALLWVAGPLVSSAGESVFDFEDPSQLEGWKTSGEGASIEQSDLFASEGSASAVMRMEEWESGDPRKTYVEITFPPENWAAYDWIVFDVVNPTDEDVSAYIYISDKEDDIDNGLRHRFGIANRSAKRVFKKLGWNIANDKSINPGKITTIRFVVERPESDVAIHIDGITLLRDKGDYSEDLPDQLQESVWEMQKEIIAAQIESATSQLDEQVLGRALTGSVWDEVERLKRGVEEIDRNANAADQDRLEMVWLGSYLEPMVERFNQYPDYYRQLLELGLPNNGFLVGFAPSMVNVMPKHLPVDLTIAPNIRLNAARNENESFQLAVAPFDRDARQVRVSASELRTETGDSIPAGQIDCDLVAYTETTNEPGYDVDYVGWWPDPIIADPKPVDVKVGEVQAWWIRVNVPIDQEPGMYYGKITVNAEEAEPMVFELAVYVYDFTLPTHAPFPLAFTTISKRSNWIENIMGGQKAWNETKKYEFADFLGDYYLMPDCIYRHPTEDLPSKLDMELIEYMRDQGKLGPFSIGYFHSDNPEWMEEYRENYEAVKEAGLEDYAYLYGWDEVSTKMWPRIEDSAAMLKERYPEIYRFTTTAEKVPPQMPSMSATCPINAGWNGKNVDTLREEYGIDSWWYTCVWPPHPYPNFFIEYDPIDARVMMGIQHAKYRPAGFLYYETAIFGENEEKGGGIGEYPYTTWNPISFGDTHGDGRWLYYRTDGTMVPSMVMENFRDGMQDLAYYMILAHKVKLYEDAGGETSDWLYEANIALTDFDEYSKYRNTYTKSPNKVYEFRDRLGRLIEDAPVEDDNPWAGNEGMPVRGIWDQFR